jgi:uncharacterized protein (TIGR03437 family)
MAKKQIFGKLASFLAVSISAMMGIWTLSQLAYAQAHVYVANSGSPLGKQVLLSVSVIDTSNNTVVATLAAQDTPWGVAIGPDGTRAYVTNSQSSSVSVIDTSSTSLVANVVVGNGPTGVAVTPDGTRAYIANSNASTVSVIDTSLNAVAATISVANNPSGVAITPDGKRAYVTIEGSSVISNGSVAVINTATNTVVATVVVGLVPAGLAITPDGTRAYVTNSGGNAVSVIDLSTNTVVTRVVGLNQPAGVAITPDGTRAYVTNTGGGGGTTVAVVDIVATDPTYNTVLAKVTVGSAPWGVAITPDGTRAYVTNEQSKSVSVIDTVVTDPAYNTVVATVDVGVNPIGVAIAKAPNYVCSNTVPPVISSVDSASAYGGYSYFASGSWLEIKGSNLADPSDPRLMAPVNPGQWAATDFNGVNAPVMLDGISASINAKSAYVWYLSPGQINVQAPEDSATGNIAITVTNCKATSSPFTFARRALAPSLLAPPSFNLGGKQYLVATFNSDGAYVLNTGAVAGINSRPARPGDLIVAYGIGFGDVTPSILPGVIAKQSNSLNNPVTVAFGSTNATLSYAGLAGNFVGLYEFYITVPPGLANGDYQINATQNGNPVPQTMYLTVHN